jgi:hypothetical protein
VRFLRNVAICQSPYQNEVGGGEPGWAPLRIEVWRRIASPENGTSNFEVPGHDPPANRVDTLGKSENGKALRPAA